MMLFYIASKLLLFHVCSHRDRTKELLQPDKSPSPLGTRRSPIYLRSKCVRTAHSTPLEEISDSRLFLHDEPFVKA